MSRKPLVIPIFIPNEGCPHRCVFCDQASITGQRSGKVSREHVAGRIAAFLDRKGERRDGVEVAFYGGNFLGLPEAYRAGLLKEAHRFVEGGRVRGLRFSTRPETVTPDSLNTLLPFSMSAVEVGVQSMDDEVLLLSRRGHTAQDAGEAAALLRASGLKVGVQIMPGLPGDSSASILKTGIKVADLRPDFVRIYPTVVVKNTLLAKWYRSGRFVPLSLNEAVDVTKRLFLLFKARGIPVIRMGLQATESLSEEDTVIAGPFHPAFGHLVHSALFLDRASLALERKRVVGCKVTIKAHPADESRVRGLNNFNVKTLTRRFVLEDLQVVKDRGVARDTIQVVAGARRDVARPQKRPTGGPKHQITCQERQRGV